MQHLRSMAHQSRARGSLDSSSVGSPDASSLRSAEELGRVEDSAEHSFVRNLKRKELIMGVFADSQLFGPLLTGERCLGRVKVPLPTLLMHVFAFANTFDACLYQHF